MSKVWYGSINNRLEENRMYCNEIVVGTGVTEYYWSDRHPYEVVEVMDQKHVKVREMGHKATHINGFANEWELFSDEKKPIKMLTKRGKYWYWTVTVTKDIFENDDIDTMLFLAHNNINVDKLKEKGKVTRYHRANVSFGVAEYYYDYEF